MNATCEVGDPITDTPLADDLTLAPEQRLLVAVILQALHDYAAGPSGSPTREGTRQTTHYYTARAFLFGPRSSLPTLCLHLPFCPREVRQRAEPIGSNGW